MFNLKGKKIITFLRSKILLHWTNDNKVKLFKYSCFPFQREIIEMEHGIAETHQKVEDLTPGFEELEQKYDARTAKYEKLKKDIVGM